MSAKVESAAKDEYAYVDDHGRYKLKMLFDLISGTPPDQPIQKVPTRLVIRETTAPPSNGVHPQM